ncbi:hypothetical protein AALO_G00047290, partial [Alosa alosa]
LIRDFCNNGHCTRHVFHAAPHRLHATSPSYPPQPDANRLVLPITPSYSIFKPLRRCCMPWTLRRTM